jgi:hypothetical protein
MTEHTNTQEPIAPVAPAPAPAKTRQMSFTVLEDGRIQAEFGEGVEKLHLNPGKIPESMQAAAMAEGLISRARGYTSRLTDKERTPQALHDAVAKAFSNLLAGTWKVQREAGETEYSIEVEAAFLFRQMRAKAKNEPFEGTIAEAAEGWEKLSDEQKKQLKALSKYQVALAEVKAKRASEKLAKLQAKAAAEPDIGF